MAFKPSKIEVKSLVGRAAGPAEKKFNGDLTELRIGVGHRRQIDGEWQDTNTTWVTYKANGEYGAALDAVAKGDLVEITDAVLETREYDLKTGGKGLAVDIRFGTLTVLERKADREGSAPSDNRTATAKAADTDDGW